MPLIVLWDIDHTLIENSGVSKEIYAAAFERLAERPALSPAVTEGRTDRLIMREMFRTHGLPEPGWGAIEQALERAGAERLGELQRRGWVLPGARDVLKALSVRRNWVSSVLTGNIAANARVKLNAFDLADLLDLAVGAYGEDAVQREDLVEVARERLHRARPDLPVDTPVVLVGDTLRDIGAARASGASVIAVATGVHTAEELRAAGAEIVLPDLADTEAVVGAFEELAHR
jgi:phosphoglycolate phosphatase-like HAD superfamily hydrolase